MSEVRSGCAVRAAIQDELAEKHEAMLTEQRAARAFDVLMFAKAILHGDAEHRKWLMEAAKAYSYGQPLPPARNGSGLIKDEPVIRDIPHWNKVGQGTPLGIRLETMHQDEYRPEDIANFERGVHLCHARILLVGDEIEWIDCAGYSTLVNPGSFKAPTHWRWQGGAGI